MSVRVIIGPAALKQGCYWIGVASGHRWCTNRRRTPERAMQDASTLEQTMADDTYMHAECFCTDAGPCEYHKALAALAILRERDAWLEKRLSVEDHAEQAGQR